MQVFENFPGLATCASMVAAAAGVWFIRKHREKVIRMKDLKNTPVDKDPVQRFSSFVLDADLMDMPMDKVTSKGSLAKSKVENEKGKVSNGQKNIDAGYVLNLEKRLMMLEKLLIEAHREAELKSSEGEKMRQCHSILKEKCHEILKALKVKGEEHESNLKDLKDRGTYLEELLFEVVRESEKKDKVLKQERQHSSAIWSHCEAISESLAETREIAEIAVEYCAQVEHEKSILMDQVKTLTDSVEMLEEQLEKTRKNQVNQVKSTLKLENSILRAQVKTLQDLLKKLEKQLDEASRMYDEKMNKCEKEDQAYSNLKEKFDEMQEVMKQEEEVIKVAVAEAMESA